MPNRFDWEAASLRDKQHARKPPNPLHRDTAKRQEALAAFAASHDLSCFSCQADKAEWAKSGITARGPWIVCVPCVNKRQAARPQKPTAEA